MLEQLCRVEGIEAKIDNKLGGLEDGAAASLLYRCLRLEFTCGVYRRHHLATDDCILWNTWRSNIGL